MYQPPGRHAWHGGGVTIKIFIMVDYVRLESGPHIRNLTHAAMQLESGKSMTFLIFKKQIDQPSTVVLKLYEANSH